MEALECAIEMVNTSTIFSQRKKFKKDGWIFLTKKYPPAESVCEVLFTDQSIGKRIYWEGTDFDPVEKYEPKVMAWKNNTRAV